MRDTSRACYILSLRSYAEDKLRELKPFLIMAPSAIIISVFIGLGKPPGVMQYVRNWGPELGSPTLTC